MTDISIIYYWYDRGEIRDTSDEKIIMDAIRNHDFDTFLKMREKYPPDPVSKNFGEDEPSHTFVYFPDTASVYENDEYIGEIDILNRSNFNRIDDTDFEWG